MSACTMWQVWGKFHEILSWQQKQSQETNQPGTRWHLLLIACQWVWFWNFHLLWIGNLHEINSREKTVKTKKTKMRVSLDTKVICTTVEWIEPIEFGSSSTLRMWINGWILTYFYFLAFKSIGGIIILVLHKDREAFWLWQAVQIREGCLLSWLT